jgi:hypothetical protein
MIFHVQKNFELWKSVNDLFNKNIQSLTLRYSNKFSYNAGSDIFFQLYVVSGRKPFIWRYYDMPSNLFGD